MKVLFMPAQGQCLFDRFVASITGGEFCHVEIILQLDESQADLYTGAPEVRLSSVWGENVKCIPSGEIPRGWTYLDLGAVENEEAVREAMQCIGKPYGKFCALASPFADLSGEQTCCSLLVLHILKKCIQVPLRKGSPNDLFRHLAQWYIPRVYT